MFGQDGTQFPQHFKRTSRPQATRLELLLAGSARRKLVTRKHFLKTIQIHVFQKILGQLVAVGVAKDSVRGRSGPPGDLDVFILLLRQTLVQEALEPSVPVQGSPRARDDFAFRRCKRRERQ